MFLISYAVGGAVYIIAYHYIQVRAARKGPLAFSHAITAGIGIGLLSYLIPNEIRYMIHPLVIVTAISTAVTAGRRPAYLLLTIVSLFQVFHSMQYHVTVNVWITHAGILLAVLIAVETIQSLKNISRQQVARLEAANKISKQMISTLEKSELIKLLDLELRNILKADTYFVGIHNDGKLYMELFYDEGEYFNGMEFELEGSLSEWVIRNNAPLFLPDLRKAVRIEGIRIALAGKKKTSLSWIGAPIKGTHVNGVLAAASYQPNAFNRSDLELLLNIAQVVTLSLDNSYHHAQVEEQARLDSLTQVYNHGHFIQTLQAQAEACRAQRQRLSLIMLDIDHFKQYNDSFGHAAGDEILVNLCKIIRAHIKQNDAVGRWGGEEFAISLPNTTSEQAQQVAQRIRKSLAELKLGNSHKTIPAPTASMGIAVFPDETTDVNALIDLADQRLYVAKERGRDQIETSPAR
jgi:diguanylate cyclase (GGDEF)-like protein